MTTAKQFTIPKPLVFEAFKAVAAHAGAAGVDQQSVEDFASDLREQPVQGLESAVVGELLPAASPSGRHSEEEWRRA